MSHVERGARRPIGGWDDVVDWLTESFEALDLGDVLEIGPAGADILGDEKVPCVTAQKLEQDAVWLQVSHDFVAVPVLATFAIEGVPLDTWMFDIDVSLASEGYIVSRDLRLLAEIAVAWFADRPDLELTDLGCELTPAVRLG